MGRLSTHVLDTMHGKPANEVAIDLHILASDGAWQLVKQACTNADGRTDQPLLSGSDFKTGTYMLTFDIGAYFNRRGVAVSSPAFLDHVPVRFTMADQDGHYHVPLLATPWSYSTYRGS